MTSEIFSDHLNSFLCFTFGEQSNEGQAVTPQSDTPGVAAWSTKKETLKVWCVLLKVPQVFKRESKALGISKESFHLASNSYGNHVVKRQMRILLQMSQTSAKPNICSAWPADEGRSQQVDITSQHRKQLFPLLFQFSRLSDMGQKQLPVFQRKKRKRRK